MEILPIVSSAKSLSKNPLGIIALFIVLVYGFACLLFGFSSKNLELVERQPFIWFVVLFPLAVLALFGWLVSKHHDKLYAPTDYKDDGSFLKTIKQNTIEANQDNKYIKDLLELGNDFTIILEHEELIKNDLKKRGLNNEEQTTMVLIRHLAASQVINWFEKTYYNIFGSQIQILKYAFENGSIDKEMAVQIFENTRIKNIAVLSEWSFDVYLTYLFSSGLLESTVTGFKLTTRGNQFLKLLAGSGYSTEKNL
jgi:hypothetical protein